VRTRVGPTRAARRHAMTPIATLQTNPTPARRTSPRAAALSQTPAQFPHARARRCRLVVVAPSGQRPR
jgi:hypothetical protein